MTMPREDAGEIRFEEGIIGVPRARRFHLLAREDSPIGLLRCLDVEGLALPVSDPTLADAAYRPSLAPRVLEAVDAVEGDPLIVLAVTTLSLDGATANLRAPVVINPRRRLAAQIILDDRGLSLRAPVRTHQPLSDSRPEGGGSGPASSGPGTGGPPCSCSHASPARA